MDAPTDEQIAAMSPRQRKSLENRARRAAERQGLRVRKSYRRDPRALDFGRIELVDGDGAVLAAGSLSDVWRYLLR
jgi:hypothetical protein